MTKDCLKYYEEMIDEYKQMIKVIPSMDEEKMQVTYGTDETKEELIEALTEEVQWMEKEVAEYYREQNESYEYEVDPAFASEEDCMRQFI